ncbi:unnamed protein product [Lepeophtheirus salmonis]|uniref:(salmon louse) hypothetical protein n=1 Tax=Lepeophtheirus salmonis TaxID=72036 RepID=A0A7R8CVA1_LEPSM|nr:unnamed protein product [Lepeophtheirus salmonis]CAF2942124.1 unnamed protein product [Lepeophtheirus salmonis]
MPLLEGTSSSLFQDKINLLKDRNRNTYIYPQTMSLPHFKLMDFFDTKRSGARGFHEGIFDQGFGGFSPLRKRAGRLVIDKRRPEMTSRGIHADAFTSGFGDFYTMKRSPLISSPSLEGDDTLLDERRRINDRLIELLIERDALSEGNEDDLMSRA